MPSRKTTEICYRQIIRLRYREGTISNATSRTAMPACTCVVQTEAKTAYLTIHVKRPHLTIVRFSSKAEMLTRTHERKQYIYTTLTNHHYVIMCQNIFICLQYTNVR